MWDIPKIFAALSASSLCISTGCACGIFTETVAGSAGAPEKSMLESCSWRRAVCCLSVSVSVSAQSCTAGGGAAAGSAGLASKRESRFATGVVSGPGVLAGSRKEAWASEARGESKSTDSDATGFTRAGITGTSGMVFTGATGRTGTTGGGGVAEGNFRGTYGSKDVNKVEESGATGATGFCGKGSSTLGTSGSGVTETAGMTNLGSASFGCASLTTETGAAGFGAMTLGEAFTAGASTLVTTGRGIIGEPLAEDELSATGT